MLRWLLLLNSFDLPLLSFVVPACTSAEGSLNIRPAFRRRALLAVKRGRSCRFCRGEAPGLLLLLVAASADPSARTRDADAHDAATALR